MRDALLRHIRYGLRSLRRSRGFAAVIIATLAGQMVHLQVSERQFRLAVVALLLVAGGLCFL